MNDVWKSLDFSACPITPFEHQRIDTASLIAKPYFFIASEMRTGKTKIVIDAAQFLFFLQNKIDKVIVVTPAPVRDVWFDPQLGELNKHLWKNIHQLVHEYHTRYQRWSNNVVPDGRTMHWYVTNFEFLRSKQRLVQLMPACGPRTLLVLDESSFVKNYASAQTKACLQLRRACGRVVLINGTPIFHSPLDLFSQGNLLHPSILECKYITHFKARYAVQEAVLGRGGKPLVDPYGRAIKKITGWTNLDDLERRFAPYTVRRLQKDCLDLPPKLDPVTLTATLEPQTWRSYKEMREELVLWLGSGGVATSATAAIKSLRLSQITSGFLGGVEDVGLEHYSDGDVSEPEGFDGDEGHHDEDRAVFEAGATSGTPAPLQSDLPRDLQSHRRTVEISREKLDVLLWFIEQRLEEDPRLHLAVWCRFRSEALRAAREIKRAFPQFEVACLMGAQNKTDRHRALALLKPGFAPEGPAALVGVEGTGSFGLDMAAAHTCVTLSSGYTPGRVSQTLDRLYGPGQQFPIAYFNIVATGPRGERTIDHMIIKARQQGQDLADTTAEAWVMGLKE